MQVVDGMRERVVVEPSHQPRHHEMHGQQLGTSLGTAVDVALEPGDPRIGVLRVEREAVVDLEYQEGQREPKQEALSEVEIHRVVRRSDQQCE